MDEQIQQTGESQDISYPSYDLSVGSIIANGFSLGFKHLFVLILSVILWAITFWIPYINVGTTIGLYGIVIKMARGENFGAGEIFNKEYRAIMPEFLILYALYSVAVYLAYVFLIIPGIVLSIALGYSFYFMIDKKLGILEALSASNKTTNGNKWEIFGAIFILYLILLVLILIIWLIFRSEPEGLLDYGLSQGLFGLGTPNALGILLIIVVCIIMYCVIYGAMAYTYRELSKKYEALA